MKEKEWKKKQRQDPGAMPPQKSKTPIFYIPGNSSATSIIKNLDENDGIGVIFETEADTLTGSLKQDWGNFGDMLRKAFHHEPVSMARALDDLLIEIPKPRLSILLTGTPDQVSKLINSTYNGLFSRFAYYVYQRKIEWRNPQPCDAFEDFGAHFREIGISLGDLKHKLDEEEIVFYFNTTQFQALSFEFSKMTSSVQLFEGISAASSVFRLGLIAFRIAMILTIVRAFESQTLLTPIECHEKDFVIAMDIVKTLFVHSMIMFDLLPKQDAIKHPGLREFYFRLPNTAFSRKEADEIGNILKHSNKTVYNYLKLLLDAGQIEKTGYGRYQKVQKD